MGPYGGGQAVGIILTYSKIAAEMVTHVRNMSRFHSQISMHLFYPKERITKQTLLCYQTSSRQGGML